MKKILDKVYEPQSVFQKTNSVYMEWYGRGDEKMYKEKSGANQVMVDYIQKNAKETGKGKLFIFGSLYLLGLCSSSLVLRYPSQKVRLAYHSKMFRRPSTFIQKVQPVHRLLTFLVIHFSYRPPSVV